MNTVLTGEAQFQFLHEKTAEEIQDGLKRATKRIDTCLNLIGGRLGLDHDQVFFGRFGVPVMVRYLDQRSGPMDAKEATSCCSGSSKRACGAAFSGSTESFIDQDLAALEGPDGGLDKLLDNCASGMAGCVSEPDISPAGASARASTPAVHTDANGTARDWGTGLPLKANLLGKMSRA